MGQIKEYLTKINNKIDEIKKANFEIKARQITKLYIYIYISVLFIRIPVRVRLKPQIFLVFSNFAKRKFPPKFGGGGSSTVIT